MTKEERVLRAIRGEELDYLPSQITFADNSKYPAIAAKLGLPEGVSVDDYLENHIHISLTMHDMPLFLRNDIALMRELERKGYTGVDEEGGVVYDSWGLGIKIGEDGFFCCYSPLKGDKAQNDRARPFLPASFNRDILDMDLEDAVEAYQTPDPDKAENFDGMRADLEKYGGDLLVMPSGYLGIYERCYSLMGFESFMMECALRPELVGRLMDKITDYKVEVAKRKVAMGVKVAHHGDDLGVQTGGFFRLEMFRELIKPRIARLFSVYKEAGIPIMMHSCGNITSYIPDLLEIGLDALEPVQPCMDLEHLKAEFGDRLTLWGGIDTQQLLPFGTPEEVAAEAARVIRILCKGGRHIIAPSQEIMADVPIENIVALLNTIKKERYCM